ncbi:hypothetical protein NKI72_32245 [Mesorhizobium sp. M0437]|uniref:hypothetical protein n=1 Tax=Mesorhizobium sp. M0437 TaxID=2956945 RepID=UPI00333670F9
MKSLLPAGAPPKPTEPNIPITGLANLLCGRPTDTGVGKSALEQLKGSITDFSTRAVQFLGSDQSVDTTTFGPFCSRVILENGAAALLGRLDPFRLLYLSEFQAQPEYVPGKRVRSAFSWASDVLSDDKPVANLWDADHDMPKISRSLFSRHIDHIFWRPALDRLLDHVSSRSDEALKDVLTIDPEDFIPSTKGKCSQLYSQLSKGVHWEFFSSALQMDEITVKTLIRDTFLHLSVLGLASHFVPTAYASIRADDAVEEYIAFRGVVP